MKLKNISKKGFQQIKEDSQYKLQQKSSYHILCIDHDETNVKSLMYLLQDFYNVIIAKNTEDAYKVVKNQQIDVIITDQKMPGMQGTDFLDRLTRENLTDNIRIMLTGYTDINDLIGCINNGLIDRYLVKPWEPEELLNVIKESISKIQTKRTLQKLLPEQFIKNLYPKGLDNVEVGFGEEMECVVLFADVRKFTALAEGISALDTFKLISSFFKYIAPIITKHHGFIDKFMGDGIMAIFNRKKFLIEDSVRCAIEMSRATEKYNEIHRSNKDLKLGQEFRKPLKMGMGLFHGDVIIGTVGYENRLDFTVLGDAVNTASRVQGLTSRLNIPLIIPDNMANDLDDSIATRYIGHLPLRGKTSNLSFYEVFEGDPIGVKKQKQKHLEKFEQAIHYMEMAELFKAEKLLSELESDLPNDPVLQYFLQGRKSKKIA